MNTNLHLKKAIKVGRRKIGLNIKEGGDTVGHILFLTLSNFKFIDE